MNIRCAFCQTPYTLSRVEMLDALQEMDAHKLTHYDAHCPRCRRATQIPRQRMEMAMPNWRDELKEFEAEMREHPQQEAPLPVAEPVAETRQSAPVARAESKPEPKAVEAKKPAARSAPKTSSPKGKASTAKSSSKEKKSTAATSSKGKKTTTKSK